MESPGSFMGGVVGFVPFLAYGVAEWIAWYRRRQSMERKLAYANLGCAAFIAFGVTTNIGESLTYSEQIPWSLLAIFASIGSAMIAYLTACGLLRLRWTRNSAFDANEQQ